MSTATPEAPTLNIDSKPYAALCASMRETGILRSMRSLMGWDQETMMPSKGADLRADQLETISALIHEKSTSPALGDLIAACEADAAVQGDDAARANVREMRRDYDKATKLPPDLVREIARIASKAMHAWKGARANNDFEAFRPWLEQVITLNRRKAECYGIPSHGKELFDALMDEYEPGMTAARTSEIFTPLRAFTVELLEKVKNAKPADQSPAEIVTPIAGQKAFARFVAERFGFDFDAGRMDDSTHPFCETVGPGDVRLTNRYRDNGWADALSSGTHEAGHGLYEQGLPTEHFGTPLGDAVSLGIHESQSRMWENMVARSKPFWEWALPHAKELMGPALKNLTPEQIFKADNVVRPSFIRVEADEVTYNLHIMLRFDLERAMISGDLHAKDLPGVWNDRMKSDFGLDVPEPSKGCLQDIHWSMSAVGYFATYTFGNLYAAQFWEAIAEALPNRTDLVARGEFAPILEWVREHIHQHGRRYTAAQLCERATGKPLSSEPLMRHLSAKVNAVYGV
ncbi:MAG: carboxypeptidase M32 [Phycisphaerales bacterium]